MYWSRLGTSTQMDLKYSYSLATTKQFYVEKLSKVRETTSWFLEELKQLIGDQSLQPPT